LEGLGKVDARLLGVMMHAPLDSVGQFALLARALEHGVIPNVVVWSMVIAQLKLEGDDAWCSLVSAFALGRHDLVLTMMHLSTTLLGFDC
jgi:hypothetical protein